jgi:hypothetical protein
MDAGGAVACGSAASKSLPKNVSTEMFTKILAANAQSQITQKNV